MKIMADGMNPSCNRINLITGSCKLPCCQKTCTPILTIQYQCTPFWKPVTLTLYLLVGTADRWMKMICTICFPAPHINYHCTFLLYHPFHIPWMNHLKSHLQLLLPCTGAKIFILAKNRLQRDSSVICSYSFYILCRFSFPVPVRLTLVAVRTGGIAGAVHACFVGFCLVRTGGVRACCVAGTVFGCILFIFVLLVRISAIGAVLCISVFCHFFLHSGIFLP